MFFSLTLDNASANDNMQDILKEKLSLQDSLLCDDQFFHVRYCAYILNLIVQEGLKVVGGALDKIRESIKYVKASEGRMKSFHECVSQVGGINTKIGLRLMCPLGGILLTLCLKVQLGIGVLLVVFN